MSIAKPALVTKRATRRSRRERAPGHAQRMRFVAICIVPIMLLFLVFSFLPICMSIILSMYRYNPLDATAPFIGFRNYTFAFTKDVAFRKSVVNTFLYVLIAVPLNIVLTLPIAMALNKIERFKAVFRTIFFMPSVASLVAVAFVWSYMYEPQAGIINTVLRSMGLPGRFWLSEPQTALYAIILVAVWQDMGYNIIVFLAGLQTIPEMLHEAATVDGATAWQRFRYVTMPLLSRTMLLVTVLTTLSYMQVFIPMQVMTAGGPLDSSRTVVLHIWDQAFRYLKMGYASSLSVMLLIILLVITLIQMRFLRTNWEY